MANPFVKGWKYLMALFGAKIDEHADPIPAIASATPATRTSREHCRCG